MGKRSDSRVGGFFGGNGGNQGGGENKKGTSGVQNKAN